MLIPTEPIWIDSAEHLAELCAAWRLQGAIAVDTEFMRTDTFYPIAGLLQIGDGKGCYLIDPLAIGDWQPLRELLLDEQVTKVLHACSEDLEVFQRWLDLVPAPVFDTQIGAAFANLGFGLGYASLVKALLGIDIPKDVTRSDWLQRPLSQSQLQYAALDVAHMLVVYGTLLQRLKANGRLGWVKSDCADMVAQARQPDDFSEAYHKVPFAWKLQPQELAVLQQLCIWRETQARLRDIPRNRLIKEPSLWDIARKKPRSPQQLQQIADIPQRTLKNDTESLLAITHQQLASDASSWPARLDPPLAQAEGPLLKALKQRVRERAEELQIPAEVLIRKKEYEQLVRSGLHGQPYQLPKRLLGWRHPVIGEALLQLVNQRGHHPETEADQ